MHPHTHIHTQVDGGIKVDLRGNKGHTALHIGAMHGRTGVVNFLVARGACLDQTNHEGLTPRHLLNLFCETRGGGLAGR